MSRAPGRCSSAGCAPESRQGRSSAPGAAAGLPARPAPSSQFCLRSVLPNPRARRGSSPRASRSFPCPSPSRTGNNIFPFGSGARDPWRTSLRSHVLTCPPPQSGLPSSAPKPLPGPSLPYPQRSSRRVRVLRVGGPPWGNRRLGDWPGSPIPIQPGPPRLQFFAADGPPT